MIFSAKNASDEDLICRGIELLAHGVIPLEQWAVYFANEKYSHELELGPKAFFVWFTTMTEFLIGQDEVKSITKEMKSRNIDDHGLCTLLNFVKTGYESILSMYTKKEQVFIGERRQHIVHGLLHSTVNTTREFNVWSRESSKIEKISFSKNEYISLMTNYFNNLKSNTDELLNRLLSSQEFNEYTLQLRVNHNLPWAIQELISKFGIRN